MKFIVSISLNNVRKFGITSGYRPDWISESKPDYNGAYVSLMGKFYISPGDTGKASLEPFKPELWSMVRLNDTLKCMEGATQVGEALVLEIL